VQLAIGQTHEISLESNASTGFTWLAHYDDKILELVEERYEQPSASSGQPALGAAGAQIFVFKGLTKGETAVTFEYMRPWESLPPEKTQEYTFSVR
jgi:predicted secreted protein